MIRTLSFLLLLCLASLAGAVATTTTIDCKTTTACQNQVTQAATNATENIITITVSPGHPVTVEFNNDGGSTAANAAAWKYRTTSGVSTTDSCKAANQALKLRFTQTTSFYTVRQTADGVLSCTPLLVE